MNKSFIIILLIFIISRFLFLANYPHFFDSPEYLRESLSSSYSLSLKSSHAPVHPIYLRLIQLSQKFFKSISLISAIFGTVSFLFFYLIIRQIFDERFALYASIPLIFFPHTWLIQTNIMHEAVEQGFFMMGLYWFVLFLRRKQLLLACMSAISFSLAVINFVGIVLWFPIIVAVNLFVGKKRKDNLTLSLLVICASITLGIFLLSIFRIRFLLDGYEARGLLAGWSILDIVRTVRNIIFISFFGYSPFALLVSVFTLIRFLKTKKNILFIISLAFLLPFFLSGRFWYGGLYGRYSTMIGYLFALAFAVQPKKIYFSLLIGLFIFFSCYVFLYISEPIPKIQGRMIQQVSSEKDDLIILSEYQRPQLSMSNALYVNCANIGKKEIVKRIEHYLQNNKNVYISEQAMTFPYWQYDGQSIHIISMGDKKKGCLYDLSKTKHIVQAITNPAYPLLSVYQIKDFKD